MLCYGPTHGNTQSTEATIDTPMNAEKPMSHQACPIPEVRCLFWLGRIS